MFALLIQLPAANHYDTITVLELVGVLLLFILSTATGLEKVYGWFTGGVKKKDAAVEQRFAAIEEKQRLHSAEQLNQHNTLHEYERERERLAGGFRAEITALQKSVLALEAMPGRVNTLEAKLDNLTTQITDLKTGQHQLKQEMREDMRLNKNEVLDAIKGLRPNP